MALPSSPYEILDTCYTTGLTQPAIQPSAERYFILFCVSFFVLEEHKNRYTDKTGSTMLSQAKKAVARRTA
jgi:hypothetical protein